MVIVQVNSSTDKKTYIVEKNILVRHSEYFADLLNKRQAGSGAHEVFLLEVEPEIFNIFRHFVKTGQIYSKHDGDFESAHSEDGEGTDREWARLIDSWVLGERLRSCSFKDAIVDGIIDKLCKGDCYSPDMQDDIYPQSHKTSGIRKLIVNMAIWNHDKESLAQQGCRKDMFRFYFDMVMVMQEVKQDGMQKKAPYVGQDTCKYHEHAREGKSCYKTMR